MQGQTAAPVELTKNYLHLTPSNECVTHHRKKYLTCPSVITRGYCTQIYAIANFRFVPTCSKNSIFHTSRRSDT